MSDTKFTKGDWYCVLGDTYACVRINGKVVADLRTVNTVYNKYDAHLVAAAPEMYEYLSHMLEHDVINDSSIEREVESLLAKARGEK